MTTLRDQTEQEQKTPEQQEQQPSTEGFNKLLIDTISDDNLYNYLFDTLTNIFQPTNPEQISGSQKIMTNEETKKKEMNEMNLTITLNTGSQVDVFLKKIRYDDENSFGQKLFAKNGLSFDVLYRTYLLPQYKTKFSSFKKNDPIIKYMDNVLQDQVFTLSHSLFVKLEENEKKLNQSNKLYQEVSQYFYGKDVKRGKKERKYVMDIVSTNLHDNNFVPALQFFKKTDELVATFLRPYSKKVEGTCLDVASDFDFQKSIESYLEK